MAVVLVCTLSLDSICAMGGDAATNNQKAPLFSMIRTTFATSAAGPQGRRYQILYQTHPKKRTKTPWPRPE